MTYILEYNDQRNNDAWSPMMTSYNRTQVLHRYYEIRSRARASAGPHLVVDIDQSENDMENILESFIDNRNQREYRVRKIGKE